VELGYQILSVFQEVCRVELRLLVTDKLDKVEEWTVLLPEVDP
jgi:hypothetical protein